MADERSHPPTWKDPIVAEVREAREALFAAAGYDIHEFCRRLAERQETAGHPLVRRGMPPPRGSSGEAA